MDPQKKQFENDIYFIFFFSKSTEESKVRTTSVLSERTREKKIGFFSQIGPFFFVLKHVDFFFFFRPITKIFSLTFERKRKKEKYGII
jgi:hypothetical protein